MAAFWKTRQGKRSIRICSAHGHQLTQNFDLVVVARTAHIKKTGYYLPNSRSAIKALSDDESDLSVGPTISDVAAVMTWIRQLASPPRAIAAFGGAKVLGATIIGSFLARKHQIEPSSLASWFEENALESNPEETGEPQTVNFAKCERDLRIPDALTLEIHVIPVSLLAVQSSIAKTWIVNEPALIPTYWASMTSLVPYRSHLLLDFLLDRFWTNRNSFRENLAIVLSVLVETVVFGSLPIDGSEHSKLRPEEESENRKKVIGAKTRAARGALKTLVHALPNCQGDHFGRDSMLACLDGALRSRDVENAIGSPMPALALSQAISRATADRSPPGIPGARVIAQIVPVMLERTRHRHRLPREEVDKLMDVFRLLKVDWPRELGFEAGDLLKEIAERAASQTLSQRLDLKAKDHLHVLRHSCPR